ncbi:glycosyl hydrolase 5 family protein-like [Juglans regia]|uniref:Glycosyl hydrolase 5 family protein-like n=3 Tax=Juglans regia TaxID=51240 RepID=A0A6P9EUP5_JUGRE|nr:glycosyl hydrolase 5 family protein-like [Juglans regia]XP_035550931.1 glycosyl hydrolase 5 family protein-like [Juglans regia]
MGRFFFFLVVFFLCILWIPSIVLQSKPVSALPLYTDSRWIVDDEGQRVKLACVNWASHMEAVVAEGLSKQPMDAISKRIKSMGFNCVRLTWPLFLATNDSLASLTVRQSFQSLGLSESVVGIQANNPSIVDLPLLQAFQAVVSSLGANNVMVILDNHISKPGWCCSNSDRNGFFGDQYFNPDLWIEGLTRMATIFNGVDNVVGMSLRNELRGPRQNVYDWYRYMQKGAEAVHAANPDVLVILSGLNYGKDLSFLHNQPVDLTFTGKLVYETHWYGFSDGMAWESGNPNQVCGRVVDNMMRLSGFLLEQGWPLFLSEFGIDLRGTSVNDNRYMNCFSAVAAELDLDWALWTLAGSYYMREGVTGLNENFGVLDWNWCDTRNAFFLQRISALQSPFRGPGLSQTRLHKLIFHPSTGLCVLRKSLQEPLRLGPCTDSDGWNYTPQKTLTVQGTYFCLQAQDLGKPARLGIVCSRSGSKWETASDSKMHLSTELDSGATVCLDVDSTNTIVTNTCKCISRDDMCDPGSQWFKLVDSTRSSSSTESF